MARSEGTAVSKTKALVVMVVLSTVATGCTRFAWGGNWNGELAGCINDARDMNAIARAMGYSATLLTDAQATAAAVCRPPAPGPDMVTSVI